MNIENRVTVKRMATLFCSIGSVVCYSYLLAGTGGYLFGKGRPVVAILGFISGTVMALLAIWVWRGYLSDLDILADQEKERKSGVVETTPEDGEPLS